MRLVIFGMNLLNSPQNAVQLLSTVAAQLVSHVRKEVSVVEAVISIKGKVLEAEYADDEKTELDRLKG